MHCEKNRRMRSSMKKSLLLGLPLVILALSILPVHSAKQNCKDLLVQSESLWINSDYQDSNAILEQVIETCPKEAEAYWRKVRNAYDLIESIPRDEKPDKQRNVTAAFA